MITLGIETSCDETAASIFDGKNILSNIVFSQTELHKSFGGVYPELAARKHLEYLLYIIDEAIKAAGIQKKDIELISVASEPGLIGALLMGVNCAKTLGLALDVPVIGVNHIEAHLFANFIDYMDDVAFPALGLIVSGGHTALVYKEDIYTSKILGTTLDDAIGECFDKVARMLDLGYPGGPMIEKLAKLGDPSKFSFSPPKVKNAPYNFSFSGLKTKVLYTLFGQNADKTTPIVPKEDYKHIAAAFQKAAFSSLLKSVNTAFENTDAKSLLVGGGVSCSETLKKLFEQKISKKTKLFFPERALTLDNAAMIAALGYYRYTKFGASKDSLTASPSSKEFSYSFCS